MNNPLRYVESRTPGIGRKPRECIPCQEREQYIKECAKKGESTIGLRQKNRYIDDFMVFVSETYGITSPSELRLEYITAYEYAVLSDKDTKDSTKKSKLSRVTQWFKWLQPPGENGGRRQEKYKDKQVIE